MAYEMQTLVKKALDAAQLSTVLNMDQIRAVLLAWVPTTTFAKRFATGVLSVDMFVSSGLVAIFMTVLHIGKVLAEKLVVKPGYNNNGHACVTVDSIALDRNYYRHESTTWRALLWLLTTRLRQKRGGFYSITHMADPNVPTESITEEDDIQILGSEMNVLDERCTELKKTMAPAKSSPIFLLPNKDEHATVEIGGFDFHVSVLDSSSKLVAAEPAIRISRVSTSEHPCPPTSVEWMESWLRQITRQYELFCSLHRKRFMFIYSNRDMWMAGTRLPETRPDALDRVALDLDVQSELERDLTQFLANRSIYDTMGMPYRRGYLFSGRPGTGKTTIAHAIAQYLNRDIYNVKLSNFTSDSEMREMFKKIPEDAIVLMEDIDAQTKAVHKRQPVAPETNTSSKDSISLSDDDETLSQASKETKVSSITVELGITLSELLEIMDGRSMKSGILFILTSNHPEKLDPALIRPGRVDWHLEMHNASHFQIQKMHRMVRGESVSPLDLADVPDRLLSPCNVIRLMLMNRSEPADILVEKLRRLSI